MVGMLHSPENQQVEEERIQRLLHPQLASKRDIENQILAKHRMVVPHQKGIRSRTLIKRVQLKTRMLTWTRGNLCQMSTAKKMRKKRTPKSQMQSLSWSNE